ncbi:hypothetical protein EON64_16385, partial [archaeon]
MSLGVSNGSSGDGIQNCVLDQPTDENQVINQALVEEDSGEAALEIQVAEKLQGKQAGQVDQTDQTDQTAEAEEVNKAEAVNQPVEMSKQAASDNQAAKLVESEKAPSVDVPSHDVAEA